MIDDLSFDEQQRFLFLIARLQREAAEPLDIDAQTAQSARAIAACWAAVEAFPPARRWAAAEGLVQALVIQLVSLKSTSLRLLSAAGPDRLPPG